MVLVAEQAGVCLVHVPYRGGGPAMNDIIAGHVDLLIGSTALELRKFLGEQMRVWGAVAREQAIKAD